MSLSEIDVSRVVALKIIIRMLRHSVTLREHGVHLAGEDSIGKPWWNGGGVLFGQGESGCRESSGVYVEIG